MNLIPKIGIRKGLRYCFDSCKPLWILAEWTGLEPATPGVTGREMKP